MTQRTWTWQPDLKRKLDAYYKTSPKIHFSPRQPFFSYDMYMEYMNAYKTDGRPFPGCFNNGVELVYEKYGMPYPLYDYQRAWVGALAAASAAGMYFEVGAGKTATATVAALAQRIEWPGQTIVLMPPILLPQWYKWLKSIKGINSVLMYRGTPHQRKKLNLDAEFVLMSMDIFKRDFDRIYTYFEEINVTLIVDEAVCVKNTGTQNHKCVWAFHNQDTSKLQTSKRKTSAGKTSGSQVKADNEAVASLREKLKGLY